MAGLSETRRLLGASLDDGDCAARRQLEREQRQVRQTHDERDGALVIQRREFFELHRSVVDVLERNLPLRHVPPGHVNADIRTTLLDVGQHHAPQLKSTTHRDRTRVEEDVLAPRVIRALVERHLCGEVEGVSRHAVLVVKLRGQPLTGGEGLETEAIRVLRELVLGSNGVERGFEVLYEVEATSVGTIQVGGVGGLPAGREDRVNVIADANLGS